VEPQSNNQISSQEFIKKELSEDRWAKIPLCTVQYCAVWLERFATKNICISILEFTLAKDCSYVQNVPNPSVILIRAVWIRLNQKHIVAKNEPYINIKTFTCC
jgi:hypothetical protein